MTRTHVTPLSTPFTRWTARGAAVALLGVAIVGPLATPLGQNSAFAAPPLPDPVVLYQEDFENTATGTDLASYVSATGMTYTAAPDWLDITQCNGFIVKFSEIDRPVNACSQTTLADYTYSEIRWKARALGLLRPNTDPEENFALSTGTAKTVPDYSMTPGDVMFRTATDLALPAANGRFITFSVDAAATACQAPHPLLSFSLAQGAQETPVSATPIDPCTDPRAVVDGTVSYGRFAVSDAFLFSGSTLGVVLRNEQNTSIGNDGAIDNILVLDATPTLSFAFDAPLVETTTSTNLVFTVLNTSELSAKTGWGFSAPLPPGLTIASAATTTCGGALTAAPGGSTVAVAGGTLANGTGTCTVTVPVTSATDASFTLAPAAVTQTALNPAAAAAATQFDSPEFTATLAVDSTRAIAGDTVTYTATLTNTGSFAVPAADVTLVLADALDDATLGATTGSPTVQGSVLRWNVPLAVGETRVVTAAVTVSPPGGGDGTLTAALWKSGDTAPCPSCTAETLTAAYSATVESDRALITEGQTVTFRMVIENLGSAAFDAQHPLEVSIDLTDALDDATLVSNGFVPAAGSPVVTWSGPLAVGASTTLEATLQANQPATGNHQMIAVGAVQPGGTCADACTAEVTVEVHPTVHTGGEALSSASNILLPVAVLLLLAAVSAIGIVIVARRRRRDETTR